MASIIKIRESWRALVRRKGHPTYCKTIAKKLQAEAWARQIEADIDKGEQPAPGAVLDRSVRMDYVIAQYRDLRDCSRPISDASNEHYTLRHLVDGLGEQDVMALSPHDLVGYCQMRMDDGTGPYTRNMEISKQGTAMRYAGEVAMKVKLPDVEAN